MCITLAAIVSAVLALIPAGQGARLAVPTDEEVCLIVLRPAFADATELATALQAVFGGASAGRRELFAVRVDVATNRLWILGTGSAIAKVRAMLAHEEPVRPALQIVRLLHVSAVKLEATLRAWVAATPWSSGPPMIVGDEPTNSLIVQADENAWPIVERAIREADVPTGR